MTQQERRSYLIRYLKSENEDLKKIEVPDNETEQKVFLRSLMNIRPPKNIGKDFLNIQDAYLQTELKEKHLVSLADLSPVQKGIYLWQGDITALKTDGIVNAANNALLGCFVPCHGCIDNAIHSAAGIQLRLECSRIMAAQKSAEPTGKAKITKAYNLPCKYVLHTVGPIIYGRVTGTDCKLLAGCYRSCLELADAYGLKSLAFCCISTGEFHFPNELAAEIAIRTVKECQQENQTELEVVFNVFKDSDYEIYKRLLR
ncbi:MAG: protein-ADP-ribose hydrolase [Coriobacteriia bacterium]|nr:protein-ADP-ribose hydrolase [Coriobacteriia bacterium]